MDQGVIENFKVNYRRLLLRKRIACFDENRKYDHNLLHALRFAKQAWDEVKQETVRNCFKEAKFLEDEVRFMILKFSLEWRGWTTGESRY